MRRMLPVWLLLMTGPALAATQCVFDTECLEAEACAQTAFEATLTAGSGGRLTLTTDSETLEGRMISSDDNLHYVFEAPSAAHLLTEYPDGAARYTVHLDGPFTITYHGTCEGTP